MELVPLERIDRFGSIWAGPQGGNPAKRLFEQLGINRRAATLE